MKRILFTVCAIISLLPCAAFIALWARSYRGSDYLERSQLARSNEGCVMQHNTQIAWTRGQVKLSSGRDLIFLRPNVRWSATDSVKPIWRWGRLGSGHLGSEPLPVRSVWNRLGFFQYEDGWESSFASSQEHGVAVPAWLPPAMCLVPPFFWIKGTMRRRRWRRRGCCRNCGYDLRANVSGVCPECGKPIQPTLAALVSRITPENRHGEIDIGKPVGKEIV